MYEVGQWRKFFEILDFSFLEGLLTHHDWIKLIIKDRKLGRLYRETLQSVVSAFLGKSNRESMEQC